ncbi:CPBP family intramembrane glutamic endopeptidase [Cohnella zeiphila]|uniref:CPBP family intramembrane metalloprotease n=1 Tax=Cohnella zeiphila TaxID=2761120 RepID=A0A7X0SS87_9BACL|nr:CPBP family intramembrane glutamic endopeptidase [Cohnella zeiphila]MBB6734159.1 CPBP family intramembrane metalloprotease [Cohnella zeiphila]
MLESKRMNRNRVSLIVIVYYLLASLLAFLLGLVQPVTGIPEVVVQLTQFGPTLAVLAVLWLLPRSRSLHSPSMITAGSQAEGPRRLAEAVLLPVAVIALSLLWYGMTGHSTDFTKPTSLSHPFWLIVIAQFIGAAGEEIGWRLFMQPALQTRMSVLASSVLVGLLWGVWHIGVFAEGWRYAGSFLLFAVSISVILGELLRRPHGLKLPTAAAFHMLINLGMLLWFKEESGDAYAMTTMAIACFIVAVITLIAHAASAAKGAKRTTARGRGI